MPHGLYEGEKIGVFKHIFGQNNLINLSKSNREILRLLLIEITNYFLNIPFNFIKSKYVRGLIS